MIRKVFGLIIGLSLLPGALAEKVDRQETIWTLAHNRMVRHMDVWFADGDFPRCIQLLWIKHVLDPEDYETTTDLGWMLGNIKRTDEELAVYEDYRKSYPKLADSSFPEAQFYFLKKQYDKVPDLIEPKLDLKPQPNAFRILAHSYENLHKLLDSKRVWERYLKLAPNDLTAKKNYERVLSKLKGE